MILATGGGDDDDDGARAEPGSLIGRRDDLNRLAMTCAGGARLVTVTGVGGAGKTRLVRQFAAEHGERFDGGVWFCDVSEARSSEGLRVAVGRALGLTRSTTDVSDPIGPALAGRGRCLVVLDNFEQAVEQGAGIVAEWLERAPLVCFVVTSREPLAITTEVVQPLPPLSARNAFALFTLRARGVRPDFAPDATVAQLVARLDGLPLAIEIAAACVDVLSPLQLLERIEQRFESWRNRSRDAPARHATMRALIEWSWDLLGADERAALAQCSTFRGGFTLDAAESVLQLAGGMAPLDAVRALRRKSLLFNEPTDARNGVRVRAYESVRDFAAERLVETADARAVFDRHAAYYVRRSALLASDARTPAEASAFDAMTGELGNVLAAHERSLADAPEVAARLAIALHPLLSVRGPASLHSALAEACVASAERASDPELMALAHWIRGEVFRTRGRFSEALADLALARDLAAQRGHAGLEADALRSIAEAHRIQGRLSEARAAIEQALDLSIRHRDRTRVALARNDLGVVLHRLGDLEPARASLEEALAMHRDLGDRRAEALALDRLAAVHVLRGRPDRARPLTEASLEISRELRDERAEHVALAHLGVIDLNTGRYADARRHLVAALRHHRAAGDRRNEGAVSGLLGNTNLLEGRLDDAVQHLTAALLIHRDVDNPLLQGTELRDLGLCRLEMGEVESAREALRDAVAASRRANDTSNECFALGLLGLVYTRAPGADIDESTACFVAARGLGPAAMHPTFFAALEILEACAAVVNPMATVDERRTAVARAKGHMARVAACDAGDPGPTLEERSPEVRIALRHLARALRETEAVSSPRIVLEITADGRRARHVGTNTVIDFTRRHAPRLILHALIEKHRAAPGAAIDAVALVEAGWPGESMHAESASARVRTAIWTLRRAGLGEAIVTRDDGYLLDAAVQVVMVDALDPPE